MNRTHIDNNNYHLWIERFLNAETTTAEEREMYAYFSRPDIPAEAARYRDMFGWYGSMSETSTSDRRPSSLPLRLLPLRPQHWLGIAALLAILVTIGLNIKSPSASTNYDEDGYIYTTYIIRDGKIINDPDIAQAEISRISEEIRRHHDEYENLINSRPPRPEFNSEIDNPAVRDFLKTSFNF